MQALHLAMVYMILDILEYSIKAGEGTALPVATVQLKTVPTVNDCHCHDHNSRLIRSKVSNSMLHDADFYPPKAFEFKPHCTAMILRI